MKVSPDKYLLKGKEVAKERQNLLPKGFRITSVDQRVAQDKSGAPGTFLFWDDRSETWTRKAEGTHVGSSKHPTHMFVHGAGKDGLGVHYYWDEKKQLWVDVPNPPKPPPERRDYVD